MTNASLWSMFRLIALAIFAIPICGQNTANPYDLAQSIDSHNVDWASIWKKLGVTDPPNIPPRCDPSSGLLCPAAAITLYNPSQVIAAVLGPEDVYLGFLEAGSGWPYAGHHIALKKNFGERYEISRMFDKSVEDLVDIVVDDGVSNEQLLVYTLPRLKEIASGSDAENQKWLRSVLGRCKDTPEKRTLQALLERKR